MKFQCTLIAVKDIKRSIQFYHDLFEQEVVLDFGANVTLSGGFALQENFDKLVGLPKESMTEKTHNMELYFEVDDFSVFMKKLKSFPDIVYVHVPKTYSWQQRVVRIYDPDFHIIEIGESMESVVMHMLDEGMTPEEAAKVSQMPLPYILACENGLLEEER